MFHAVTTKGAAPRPHLTAALGEAGRAAVGAWLATLEDYRPTPLVALPALAAANGVTSIHIKDEGQRLGLKSFKALGAAYAVASLVLAEAGVGGMAAAVAAYANERLRGVVPKVVVVEPQRAACLFESARAGRPVTIPHDEPTVMAMLECATPSPLGFEILAALADGFVTLAEHEATDAMKRLADPLGGDAAVVAGESGGTGLAGFLACRGDPAARAHLGLGPDSRILLFNSEGATDSAIYLRIVGRTPERVAGSTR